MAESPRFYTYNTKNGYPSYQLTARQYLNNKNDYLSAIAGLGSIPDDQSLNYNFNNFSGFVSKSVGIGFQKKNSGVKLLFRLSIIILTYRWHPQRLSTNIMSI